MFGDEALGRQQQQLIAKRRVERVVAQQASQRVCQRRAALACICYGEDEVRETIAQFNEDVKVRVRRITVGELARGATDDFLPPEDDAPEELELTPARRTALMARSGAFGR